MFVHRSTQPTRLKFSHVEELLIPMRTRHGEKFSQRADCMRSMVQLNLEEARSLARVFGEFDKKKAIILMFFVKPGSKWEVKNKITKLPKYYRVPESSLYRLVEELATRGFLQIVKGSARRGRGGMMVHDYELTMKGIVAAGINLYTLFLDSKIPVSLKEHLDEERLVQTLESNPSWPFYLEFLRWHSDRNIDLSQVKVDIGYVGSILSLVMLERPENITLERLQALASSMKESGIQVPDVTVKTVDDLRNSASLLKSIGGSFLLKLLRKDRPNIGVKDSEG